MFTNKRLKALEAKMDQVLDKPKSNDGWFGILSWGPAPTLEKRISRLEEKFDLILDHFNLEVNHRRSKDELVKRVAKKDHD